MNLVLANHISDKAGRHLQLLLMDIYWVLRGVRTGGIYFSPKNYAFPSPSHLIQNDIITPKYRTKEIISYCLYNSFDWFLFFPWLKLIYSHVLDRRIVGRYLYDAEQNTASLVLTPFRINQSMFYVYIYSRCRFALTFNPHRRFWGASNTLLALTSLLDLKTDIRLAYSFKKDFYELWQHYYPCIQFLCQKTHILVII